LSDHLTYIRVTKITIFLTLRRRLSLSAGFQRWMHEVRLKWACHYLATLGGQSGGRYRGEDGDPALQKALEIVLTDPTADIAKVMHTAAVEAQTALDARFK
jgi:hypothetical protein